MSKRQVNKPDGIRRIDEHHSDIVFLIKECTYPQYNDKGMKIGSLLDGFEFARKLQDLCGIPKDLE